MWKIAFAGREPYLVAAGRLRVLVLRNACCTSRLVLRSQTAQLLQRNRESLSTVLKMFKALTILKSTNLLVVSCAYSCHDATKLLPLSIKLASRFSNGTIIE